MSPFSRIQTSLGSDQICLIGQRIKLIGLQAEHADALFEIGSDPRIWQYFPRRVASRIEMTAWVAEALCRRDEGADLPFVIQDCMQNRIIGETRLIDYVPEHRQIEIAWTWFAPHMWGQGYGTESKLILLRYCFEKLKVIRVRITSHSSNARSRQHLEHIGATLEGILRQDRIMPDGQVRDTAYYSVIADEWPQVERRINEILRKY
jgi:RimJ/RimL family protein N-acetyltransferase